MPDKYPEISVDRYVIMPNHIHILLSVAKGYGRGDPSPTVDSAVGWIKYQCTKEINKTRNAVGEKVFQRSFYDHVVRNYEDYLEINKYIYENPRHWLLDRLYAEE